jgi:CubicO group peptidase (beta-lactamase class C family)
LSVALLVCCGEVGAGKQTDASQFRLDPAIQLQVDEIFKEWDRDESPGCAAGIIQDGQLVYRRAFGLANLEHQVPLTPESVSYLGSIAKQFTAFAVLLLDEDGKLSIDDDVRVHVPELPDYDTAISIRHLLHHTSGLRDVLSLAYYAGYRSEDYLSDEEILALIVQQRGLNFAPGERSSYSNTGYWLLGLIVERVTGMSLVDFSKRGIFDPLGMKNTRFVANPNDVLPRRAYGYRKGDDGVLRRAERSYGLIGPGGLYSTLDDLLLWDRNFYTPRVGGPDLITLMTTPGRLGNGRAVRDAMGLVIGEYRGLPTVEHSGDARCHRAQLIRFPEQSCSVVVLCNVRSAVASSLALGVADVYLAGRFAEAIEDTTAETSTAGATASTARAGELHSQRWNRLAGTYLLDGDVIEIAVADQGPTCSINSGAVRPLIQLDKLRFVVSQRQWIVSFSAEGEREASSLEFRAREDADAEIFERVEPLTSSEAKVFLGRYRSDELGCVYRITLEDGYLRVRLDKHGGRLLLERPLLRVREHLFTDGNMTFLRFQSDSKGAIGGFTLDDPRVEGVRFTRILAREVVD